MNFLFRPHALAIAALLLGLTQTPALSCEQGEHAAPLYLAVESPVRQKTGQQLGRGEYSYRFVVRDPRRIDAPYRHGRYQIELRGEATFPDGSHFYRGTTDARGRTASFRFAQAIPIEQWFVLPLSGRGELGETFRLNSEGSCDDLSDLSYMIDGELGPIFCGQILPGGYTVRYMTTTESALHLDMTISRQACQALQQRVNPIMARARPEQRILGLQQLMRDRHLAEHRGLLQEKIDALLVRQGSRQALEALLKRNLSALETPSPRAQSTVYNNLGYDLIAQPAPRHLAYAGELLDQSLRLDQNLFNMDSKAWSLYLSGHYGEALDWENLALARYGRQCNASEKAAFPEALAHRGMILWAQKQPLEALSDWARADLFTRAGGWSNLILPWDKIKTLIAIRSTEMRAEGFEESVCREEKEAVTPTREDTDSENR